MMDNIENLKKIFASADSFFKEIEERKDEIRKEKIKRMIDFFEIKNATNITHVLVNPKFFEIFNQHFSDVIMVCSANFAPEIKYWKFYDMPETETLQILRPSQIKTVPMIVWQKDLSSYNQSFIPLNFRVD